MSVGKKTFRGASWNAIAMAVNQVVNIGRLTILARLLTPADFGLYAMALVFVTFFQMFGDMGTSSALIHKQKFSDSMASSVFFFNIFFGAILSTVLFFSSPLIAALYHEPLVTTLFKGIAIVFFISSLGYVHNSLIQKEMKFKFVAFSTMAANFLSSIVCIAAAFSGHGAMSLVYQAVSYASILAFMIWIFEPWRPKLVFSIDDLKSIFHYTSHLTASNVLNYFARNADNFLIGRYLGNAQLGIYSMAYNMMLFPLQRISATLSNVLFSAFSKMQNDNLKFKEAYLNVIYFISMATFPLMLITMALADLIIVTFFGAKWYGVIDIYIILAPIGMIQSIVTTIGTIYMSKGKTDVMFRIGGINAVVTTLSFVVGIRYGIKGVAISYAAANLIMLYPNLRTAYRIIDLSLLSVARKLAPVALVSAGLALLAWIMKTSVLSHVSMLSAYKLGILLVLSFGAYALIMWQIAREDLLRIKRYI